MSTEKNIGPNPLEQFVLLAKTAKGAAAVELVKQALEAPGVYVFGELLDMPNIQELASGPTAVYHNALNLFAYGTHNDYMENRETLPELTEVQLKKLKHLTIVSLATKNKCIPYNTLLKELDMKNLRELEDLIIEVVYADIIHGKLDQKNQTLEIDYAIGRDIRPEAINEVSAVLEEWCNGCESVLQVIEAQISKANQYKDHQNNMKQKVETEVSNIKKTLKSQQQPEMEESMVTDSREAQTQDKPSKKGSKSKGLRGSGKFWGKSS